jgi:hypothetical protein
VRPMSKIMAFVIFTDRVNNHSPPGRTVDQGRRRMENKGCACFDSDARRCFEKRYTGTTKENEDTMRAEVCECPCHYEDEDDQDESI